MAVVFGGGVLGYYFFFSVFVFLFIRLIHYFEINRQNREAVKEICSDIRKLTHTCAQTLKHKINE